MRKSLLKRVIFQIHLWGGLALGLYALLIGVTGSVLVFREEIVHQIAPLVKIPEGDPARSIEEIRAGIQARYPGWHPWSLEAPAEPGEPWSSYLLQPGKSRMVFANPQGEVIGEQNLQGTWFQLVERFHSNLLLPRGRLLNGIAGLVVLFLSISGAILWWPARGEWSSALRIVRTSNWKGWVYDLHRVGGALTFAFVALFCVTGAYFTWPAVYRGVAAAVLPTKEKPKAERVLTKGTRQPIDALVASAQRALPQTRLVRVLLAQGNNAPVRIVLSHGATREQRATSEVTLNPHTAEVLAIDDFRQRRAGDHVVSWMGPLHTGHFGGLGLKIVWALAGLAMPALFVTGFLMWCNRVLAPRLRRTRAVQEAVAAR